MLSTAIIAGLSSLCWIHRSSEPAGKSSPQTPCYCFLTLKSPSRLHGVRCNASRGDDVNGSTQMPHVLVRDRLLRPRHQSHVWLACADGGTWVSVLPCLSERDS